MFVSRICGVVGAGLLLAVTARAGEPDGPDPGPGRWAYRSRGFAGSRDRGPGRQFDRREPAEEEDESADESPRKGPGRREFAPPSSVKDAPRGGRGGRYGSFRRGSPKEEGPKPDEAHSPKGKKSLGKGKLFGPPFQGKAKGPPWSGEKSKGGPRAWGKGGREKPAARSPERGPRGRRSWARGGPRYGPGPRAGGRRVHRAHGRGHAPRWHHRYTHRRCRSWAHGPRGHGHRGAWRGYGPRWSSHRGPRRGFHGRGRWDRDSRDRGGLGRWSWGRRGPGPDRRWSSRGDDGWRR